MSNRNRLCLALFAALVAILALAALAAAEIAQQGNLRVTVSGRLAPKKLPRSGVAPISVSVGGQIATTDQSLPPTLKTLRVELNRHGRLDYEGLPACDYARIQPGSSSHALAGCRPSLVGTGTFSADITLAGPRTVSGPGKAPGLQQHQRRQARPLRPHLLRPPLRQLLRDRLQGQPAAKGSYGIVLNAPLPKAMKSWGRLTGLEMTLDRRFHYKGKSHSYISSGCPAPKGFHAASFPLARTSFSFAGGARLSSVLSSTCKVRG